MNDEQFNMRWVLQQIMNDLPSNRDWLNPDLEKMAKELLLGGLREQINQPNLPWSRPPKDGYYLKIASVVLERGTCLRRNYGAVIVNDDQIVGTGYTGAPRGEANCCDIGQCPRNEAGAKPGERYELCGSVHAEMNAIIAAGRERTLGATLYLVGKEVSTGSIIGAEPCLLCQRVIVNAGISRVVIIPGAGLHYVDFKRGGN